MDFGAVKPRHINLFVLSLILSFNSITFFNNVTITFFLINILPFLFFICICLIIKNYKLDAYIFILISILCTIFGEYDSTTGIIYFCFALYCFEDKKMIIIAIIFTLVAMAIKFSFFYTSTVRTFNFLIGYLHVFLIYYVLWHPKKNTQFYNLSEINRQIISLLIQGNNINCIAGKLCYTPDTIRKRLNNLRSGLNCKNNEQLIYELIKTGNIDIKKRIV